MAKVAILKSATPFPKCYLQEKWKGKAYRLVIQRQKRIDGELDLWEGEYTYRCILTNDYESSEKEIVEFYNLRGGKD